jgi:hypothetical protein
VSATLPVTVLAAVDPEAEDDEPDDEPEDDGPDDEPVDDAPEDDVPPAELPVPLDTGATAEDPPLAEACEDVEVW